MFPFSDKYIENDDNLLIEQTLKGSSIAVNQLIDRHQHFIYNIALKFVRDRDDAHDLTQEVLIKMVTKLRQYQQKSSFRTWLYRLVFNHFLNSERKKAEKEIYSFDELGEYVEKVHNQDEMTLEDQQLYNEQITIIRNKCMTSTLLCLNREQRIVLILGSIFNLKSNIAADLLDMSPENFRKQLSRAKADLFNFMDNKCGLINPANSCRCHKKTKGFIKEGLVDTNTGQFFGDIASSIRGLAEEKNEELDYLMEQKYLHLFTSQPYQKAIRGKDLGTALLSDPRVIELFRLN
jgi:RNA polymerase sigma factor (sigma-70 family)